MREPATTSYEATGAITHGGAAALTASGETIPFAGGPGAADDLPGPAEFLCAALCACILKNIERLSQMLPFHYERASVKVVAERQDAPPRFVRMHYDIEIATAEPERRVELLHTNIRKFGTVTNTLASACPVDGTIRVVPPSVWNT